ncbi:alpha/beta hydrolase [Haladaptatus sp. DJG-WS-42]|uniref:alpha/beta fold hydrolase n=1 Tax=Haladaptatus sp. DJG-WS-42 TaxID=3120516 RepID=UPI0030D038D8
MTPPHAEPPEGHATLKTGYVTVDGTRLFYRTAGHGTPLVFVHAGVAYSRLWNEQLDVFADDYRAIAYDLRGFGRSKLPPKSYAHHRDLATVLDALNVESAHLVGASMGGAAALDFTLTHPHRVKSLTLVAPGLSGCEVTDAQLRTRWDEVEAAFEAGDFERTATIESEMWLSGPSRALNEVDAESRELVRRMLLRSYELYTDDATEEELEPPAIGRLGEVAVPVLLISGTLDAPVMEDTAAVLEAGLEDVRVEMIAGAAHLPSLEKSGEFNGLLKDFLNAIAE